MTKNLLPILFAILLAPGLQSEAEIMDSLNYDVLPGSLLTDTTDNDVLKSWLGGSPIGTLLYRRSVHGANSTVFHNLCDDQGPTMVLVKTSHNTVFGGFASASWDQNLNSYSHAGGSFLFNLTTDRKADLRPDVNFHQYAMYHRVSFGPTFGGGHDIYFSSDMSYGYLRSHTYEPLAGNYLTQEASTALGGPGLDFSSGRDVGYFLPDFIEEIEVYRIEYGYSLPDIRVRDVTVYLDSAGHASITAEEVDNGTSDSDGEVEIGLSQTDFDCASVGSANGKAIPVQYTESRNQPTHLHGGGYNPQDNEFWYPEWSGSTVYRYNQNHQPVGSFNAGQSQMLDLWMDLESTDYFTANNSYNTITRRRGSTVVWSYNAGYYARAVTTDDNFVYAYRYATDYIIKLNKETGDFVENISLPGTLDTRSMVYANGYLYITGRANGWSQLPDNYAAIHLIDLSDGSYAGSSPTNVQVHVAAFDGETIWISTSNSNMIHGYKISDGNAYAKSFTIIFTATDPIGFTDSVSVEVKVLDTISPGISLAGEDPFYVPLGGEFFDPGVTVWDNCTTGNVVVGGDAVDVNTIGEYLVTYDVEDATGNRAEQVTRRVIVMDPAPEAVARDITVELDENGYVMVDPQAVDGGSSPRSGIAGFSLSQSEFDCSDIGDNTVILTVTDVNNNTDTDEAIITVVDAIAPTVAVQDITIGLDENGQAGIAPSDIDNGSWDACGISSMSLDVTEFDCSSAGVHTVTLTVTDVNGNMASAKANVTILNDLPEINTLEVPADAVNISSAVEVSATFTDVNLVSAIWSWSDDVTTAGTISGNQVTGNHTFTAAGIYDVTLTIVDICGESASMTFEDIVVFDPEAGFVLGGGWIESPAGAYVEYPAHEGHAHFAFSSRYWRHSDRLFGHVSFKLHKTRMRFISRDLDWLVISDSRAVLRGEGRINGRGKYDFELRGYDAGRWGHYSGDMLRIRIWNQETGALVYDNGMEAPDDELTTTIGRGFVFIHEFGKDWWKKSETEVIGPEEMSGDILVYPNPFREYIMVEMEGDDHSEVLVELYNETGQKYISRETYLVEGKIYMEAPANIRPGMYILRVITGDRDVRQAIIFRE